MVLNSILRDSAALVWLDVRGQRSWNGTAGVGVAWAAFGTSSLKRGWGPAALSLVLGCSHRQGHMPEGELATLFPLPPGALLNPFLLFPFPPYTFLPESPHERNVALLCSVFDPHGLSHLTIPDSSVPFLLHYNSGITPGFLHGSGKLSLPPSSFLFSVSVTCRSRLCSGAPHDCTSQLSQSLEACWRAVLKLSRPWRGHLSHKWVFHSLHSTARTVQCYSLAATGTLKFLLDVVNFQEDGIFFYAS